MKGEYFPPREDIILQNEAPTDMYIMVTGAVVHTLSLSLAPVCVCVCVLMLFLWLQELIKDKNGGKVVSKSISDEIPPFIMIRFDVDLCHNTR